MSWSHLSTSSTKHLAATPPSATERLQVWEEIALPDLPDETPQIANEIPTRAILPANARLDALHIAAATFHGVDYLLTWNCRHIANAHVLARIRGLSSELHLPEPVICTPEEMMGGE